MQAATAAGRAGARGSPGSAAVRRWAPNSPAQATPAPRRALTCRHRPRRAEQLRVGRLRLAPARQQQRHRHQNGAQPQCLAQRQGGAGRRAVNTSHGGTPLPLVGGWALGGPRGAACFPRPPCPAHAPHKGQGLQHQVPRATRQQEVQLDGGAVQERAAGGRRAAAALAEQHAADVGHQRAGRRHRRCRQQGVARHGAQGRVEGHNGVTVSSSSCRHQVRPRVCCGIAAAAVGREEEQAAAHEAAVLGGGSRAPPARVFASPPAVDRRWIGPGKQAERGRGPWAAPEP